MQAEPVPMIGACQEWLHMTTARLAKRPASDTRLDAIDWLRIGADLDAQGCAVFDKLLTSDECRTLSSLYSDDARFRSRIVMARHSFGRGEYKYFNYPLPDPVARCALRSTAR
jgi:hypothetical protein